MKLVRSLAVASLATLPIATAFSCCAISTDEVIFRSQTNIVIWNPETKVQHFVRNAAFSTQADDLGFIAPSPTEPTLAEADEEAFRMLHNMRPVQFKGRGSDAVTASAAGTVEVVKTQDVAGFRASVLKVSDPTALDAWLKENGYSSSPGIAKWADNYVEKGWFLTAFKVLKDDSGDVKTGPVRMTFKADEPFNPYFVPKENTGGSGGLSVYFIAPGKHQPKTGDDNWKSPTWATEMTSEAREELARLLEINVADIPANATLSSFEDTAFPVADKEDIVFHSVPTPAAAAMVENLSQGRGWVPVVVIGVLAGGWWMTRRRSRQIGETLASK